jgi:hypothetical protein
MISFVLFAFEQLAYWEILGAEYMAFCPEAVDEEFEGVYEEVKRKEL